MTASHPSTKDLISDPNDLIPDPKSYWEMAAYSTRVMSVLMMLRHLYEPPMAVKWLNERQRLLSDDIPAELLLTTEGMKKVEAVIARITDGAFS